MRKYSNLAVEASLLLELDGVATQFTVDTTVGLPAPPFTALLSPDAQNEEVILVTGVLNQTITAVRGWNESSPSTHAAGALMRHGAVAEDFREAAMAFHHLFGDPVYDPNNPSAPPTNQPIVATADIVTKSADTWADLLPPGYVSPIPQGTP